MLLLLADLSDLGSDCGDSISSLLGLLLGCLDGVRRLFHSHLGSFDLFRQLGLLLL